MKKCATLLLTVLVIGPAQAQWGTIEGQVVWGGKNDPVRKPLAVVKDAANCLRNGPLLDELYIVDPKTKGIRSAVVWLMPANEKGEADLKAEMPIHKSIKEITEKKVVMDQPCCMFAPQVLCLREGQILTAKNSDKVTHNMNIQGGITGPNKNFILIAGTELDVEGWKAATTPVIVNCNIHTWMKGYVRVFNHPYFVATGDDGKFTIKNAPSGKYRLIAWHPEVGYLLGNKDKHGVEIKIEDKKTAKVADIKVVPEKE